MRSFVFNLVFYVGTTILAATAYLATFVVPTKTIWNWLRFWGRSGQWGVRNILDSKIEIRGMKNLPTDHPPLIAAKHQSELDVLITASLFPDLSSVAMKQLENIPFFGRIIKKLGIIVVDLAIPQNRTTQVIEGARKAYKEGRPIVIYPEGTLMALGARERYRAGIWHIYNDLGISVVPVAMSVGVIWPRRDRKKHPHQSGAYEFLTPIEPGLGMEEFMQKLEHEIETNTMRLIEEHAKGEILEAARDRYARKAANEDIPWQAKERHDREKLKQSAN